MEHLGKSVQADGTVTAKVLRQEHRAWSRNNNEASMAGSWRKGRKWDAGAEGNGARTCGVLGRKRRIKDEPEQKI